MSGTATQRPTAALLVIGDEILSGRVADSNTARLARLLRSKGVRLLRVLAVADDRGAICDGVRDLSEAHDVVFTSGGVGATHDDVTMDGVARAFGCGVVRHPEFLRMIRERDLHPDLARAPEGAELRRPAGGGWPVVVMRNVWVLPGLPEAFERKLRIVEECLPGGPPFHCEELYVPAREDLLVPVLDRLVEAHSEVRIGSYPEEGRTRVAFDGDDPDAVSAAARAFRDAVAGRFAPEWKPE